MTQTRKVTDNGKKQPVKKKVVSFEVPTIACGDGIARIAWKYIEAIEENVFLVKPGSPIVPCPHCQKKVISIHIHRGDQEQNIFVDWHPDRFDFSELWDHYELRHYCRRPD